MLGEAAEPLTNAGGSEGSYWEGLVDDAGTSRRYPNCYFEGDHIVLSLGPARALFRIQRTILVTQSETFRDMFRLPRPKVGDAEGMSDDNPIHLPDDPEHFAGVLSVYYGELYVIISPGVPILTRIGWVV